MKLRTCGCAGIMVWKGDRSIGIFLDLEVWI